MISKYPFCPSLMTVSLSANLFLIHLMPWDQYYKTFFARKKCGRESFEPQLEGWKRSINPLTLIKQLASTTFSQLTCNWRINRYDTFTKAAVPQICSVRLSLVSLNTKEECQTGETIELPYIIFAPAWLTIENHRLEPNFSSLKRPYCKL